VAAAPHRRSAGFSLIEILVVIVIIGIVLSIAILSVSLVGGDKAIREEAQRMMALLEVAQDESMLQGREFGLELMIGGYRFLELDPISGQWSEIIGDDTLRQRELPEELEIQLYIEDRPVILKPTPAKTDRDESEMARGVERYAPHVLIYSSGDLTPFELHFVRDVDDSIVAIEADIMGMVDFVDLEESL
jgi:general secretion pathway protein H